MNKYINKINKLDKHKHINYNTIFFNNKILLYMKIFIAGYENFH